MTSDSWVGNIFLPCLWEKGSNIFYCTYLVQIFLNLLYEISIMTLLLKKIFCSLCSKCITFYYKTSGPIILTQTIYPIISCTICHMIVIMQ